MSRINIWSRSLSRVEIDQRSRSARLRLEQLVRTAARIACCGETVSASTAPVLCRRQIHARAASPSGQGAAERSAVFPHAHNEF
jgi:hypothetical protein